MIARRSAILFVRAAFLWRNARHCHVTRHVWLSVLSITILSGLLGASLSLQTDSATAAQGAAVTAVVPAHGWAGHNVAITVQGTPDQTATLSLIDDAGRRVAWTGQTDARGQHVFSVTLPAGVQSIGPALVEVGIGSGSRINYWQGQVWITEPPQPMILPLALQVPAGTVGAGAAITVTGSTVPQATVRLHISLLGGYNPNAAVAGPVRTVVAGSNGHFTAHLTVPNDIVVSTQAVVVAQTARGIDRGKHITPLEVGPLTVPPAILPPNVRQDTPSTIDAATAQRLAGLPGKVIVVSLADQSMKAFDHGTLVLTTPVTTGQPDLPTVTGIFHVYLKASPFQFHSPWPLGSRFYYPPTWITYWMPFFEGYGLHDASWRAVYGPGTNFPHGSVTGSHGCVNTPLGAMTWIWNWAPVGTTVVIY